MLFSAYQLYEVCISCCSWVFPSLFQSVNLWCGGVEFLWSGKVSLCILNFLAPPLSVLSCSLHIRSVFEELVSVA